MNISFVSRILGTIGAFMASTRQILIQTNSGVYVHLIHPGPQTLCMPQVIPLSAAPSLLRYPLAFSRATRSRILARSGRKYTRAATSITLTLPTPRLPHPNVNLTCTNPLVKRMIITVPYYDGPTDLARYDDRKVVAVYVPTPCSLAVYHRPNSVAIYTGPMDFTRFWLNLHSHRVVSRVFTQRFKDAYMFKDWVEKLILSDVIPSLPRLLNPLVYYITIDEEIQWAERASWTMAGLYTLSTTVFMAVLLSEAYLELCKLVKPQVGNEDDWPWWAIDENTARSEVLTIMLAHITSDPIPINTLRQTQARVVNRRRGFLRALGTSNKAGTEELRTEFGTVLKGGLDQLGGDQCDGDHKATHTMA
ncbi:unnamed protein product [Rhizoctonia solani]|uniref:Uncharacterized protein n=1 Tax=Rhizoctonia solani TaxID=456999 RepID=A0A8H3DHZ9_9AGAM|nr:unnamed protein product [Rhizoctonia solani]